MIVIENENFDVDKFHKRLENSKANPYNTRDAFEIERLKKLGYNEKQLYESNKYLEQARREVVNKSKLK